MRNRWFWIGLATAAIVIGLASARRHEIVRFAIETGAGLAGGYTVTLEDQRIGFDRASLFGVHVSRAGEPLLDAPRIEVTYSLRDLLPGSTRRFGLVALDVDRPKLTVVRFSDGTYNFIAPSGRAGLPQAPLPQRVNPVPIRFTLHVRDAALELREPQAYDSSAKRIAIEHFNVDAVVDSSRRTHYAAGGAFSAKRRPMPFTIVGTIDAQRGYAVHRARAARFPLRSLANYFADTPVVRILKGRARNLDARLYALDVQPNVAPSYHVNLQVDIDGGALSLAALAAPIEAIEGRLQVVDNVFFLRDMRAVLAGIPLRLSGGIYDLTGQLTGAPQLRLGVYGTGDLVRLRNAFTFTKTQPIAGIITLGVLVEGPIDDPLILARGRAKRVLYGAMPFDALRAGVIYHDNTIALLPLHAYYDGTDVGIRGTLAIGNRLHSLLAVHVASTTDRLPYLDDIAGNEPMVLDAAATGNDTTFHVRGALASARGVDRAAALLALDPGGTAAVAPFWVHTRSGDLDGGYALDRPHGASGFWALADGLHMKTTSHRAFPGVQLPAMPDVSGRIGRIAVAGGGSGNDVVVAGTVTSRGARIAGMRFDRLDAAFSGTLANARIGRLRAAGPWGSFDGSGAFTTQAFAATGTYRGTFEGLQPFLGNAIPAHGRLAGPASVAVLPSSIIVQATHLAMRHATLRGVPISDASITLGIEGDRLRVYSAHARAAGGDVVAAGTFDLNPEGDGAASDALALVVNRADGVQLRGLGLPLESGQLWASGDLGAGAPLPTFGGGVTIAGGRVAQFPLSGSGDVRLSGETAHLTRVVGALGSTYANVSGSLGDLASSNGPRYALSADVPAADIAGALRTFHFPSYSAQGSFNARLHVGGLAAAPVIAGNIGVPAGALNGLGFTGGSAFIAADTRGVGARNGRVQVGTTRVTFNASARPDASTVDVDAPRADLSDFNDFFDTGDTLDGVGSVKISAGIDASRLATSGNVSVRSFRYRNLPIGDTNAVWSSTRNVVAGSVQIGGGEGRLHAGGQIGFSPENGLLTTLERSRYDMHATVSDLDLSLWVAALGFPNVPVTGRASGNATLHGRYPQLALRGSAAITGGTIGPLTLQEATASVHSSGTRIVVDRAELVTPGLTASAAGSLGLRSRDPLDLQIHASTDDLPRLVYQLARARIPVTGSFESTLQVGGTFASPTFSAGIDASNVRAHGVAIESLFGEVRLHGRALVVSNAGATFTHGEATLAGSLPLELSPLRIGPVNEPVSFDVDVVGLDPAIFDEALGNNSKLGGSIDGHFGLSGTVRAPIVVGHAQLTNGSYVSDVERTPITNATASLTFNRTNATLDRVSARFGTGAAQGSGTAAFSKGAAGLTFGVKGAARGAQFNLPAYGSGAIDADLALTKSSSLPAMLSGSVTLNDATLPFSAFVQAAQAPAAAALPLPPLGFDLRATAGKNVRVRGNGYGAGLDIGVAGNVRLQGTLASPQLDGTITSSGGTLTYFDRAFRVREGNVGFDPNDGVLPTIHAVATTNVVNPDPDRARNPYGSADITINVDGPIQDLKIGFTSNPPGYSREQVLAMIAPFGGFINGIAFNSQSPYQVQSPGGITPYGALSPLPPGAYQTRSGTITAGQEAFNLLNAQFAAGLLSPLESALGEGLGLSSVNLTLGYYGNVGLTATRLLGKTVSAIYATTFGVPQIQSFGVKFNPSAYTAATLSFYYQTGPLKLFEQPVTVLGSSNQLLALPLLGTNGFSFNLQRYL